MSKKNIYNKKENIYYSNFKDSCEIRTHSLKNVSDKDVLINCITNIYKNIKDERVLLKICRSVWQLRFQQERSSSRGGEQRQTAHLRLIQRQRRHNGGLRCTYLRCSQFHQ